MENNQLKPVIFDEWTSKKKILLVLAHPDDPEFFLGGTIAHWTQAGHEVSYLLLTRGERGVSPAYPDGEKLKSLRVEEQKAAANVLGVDQISYLDFPDGYLEVNLENRRTLVAELRRRQPDIVVSSDPQTLINHFYLNHPDHRAAGQLAVDAVFPTAGNPAFFPEQLEQGLKITRIQEVWLSLTAYPNLILDVTPQWEKRLEALKCHASQIGDPAAFVEKWTQRRKEFLGSDEGYYEQFRRVCLRIP